MRRNLDHLGRIVIPSEFRKQLGIQSGDSLDMHVVNGSLLITPTREVCLLCGSSESTLYINQYQLCRKRRSAILTISTEECTETIN